MNVKQINLYNQDYNIKDAFGRAIIAADFKSTQNYEIGDFVLFGNQLYKCLSSCSGSWDWNNWSQTTILENFSKKEEEVEITYDQKVVDELVYFLNNREDITKISNDAEFIRDGCFQYCQSLQSVNFPKCSYISPNAFYYCLSLQSVDFSVCNYIGSKAFYSCRSLQSINLLASSVCTLSNSNAFYLTPISSPAYLGYFGSIYVPSSLVDAYKSATNWTYYSDRITAYQG